MDAPTGLLPPLVPLRIKPHIDSWDKHARKVHLSVSVHAAVNIITECRKNIMQSGAYIIYTGTVYVNICTCAILYTLLCSYWTLIRISICQYRFTLKPAFQTPALCQVARNPTTRAWGSGLISPKSMSRILHSISVSFLVEPPARGVKLFEVGTMWKKDGGL